MVDVYIDIVFHFDIFVKLREDRLQSPGILIYAKKMRQKCGISGMLPGMGFAVLFARFRSACDKRMEFLYNKNSFQTLWVPLPGHLRQGFDFDKEESSVKKFVSAILVLLLVLSSFAALSENAAPPADGAGNNPPPLPPHIKEQADVVAVFAGIEKQPVRLENQPEEDQKVDTVWIYYSDNTFDQYAELRHEFELFSTGKYSFTGGGSFGPEGKD